MKHSILIFFTVLLVSCGNRQGKEEPGRSAIPIVAAVNYPVYYFAQRIGGDLIQAEFPVPAGLDPAYWVPDDEALSVFQSADVILANGADYAKWMHNVSLPASRIINTSQKEEEQYIQVGHGSSHSHGPDGEHEHVGFAFTTWLDFQLAARQAESVRDILIRKLPESQVTLEEKYRLLEKDLLSVHASMNEVSALIRGENIIGSHPVYQYLAEAYGLNIRSVHFEPGEMPLENQWTEFDALLENHPSSIMLWEGEPLSEIGEILQEKGILTVVFNPCGNRPEKGDFIDLMKHNIRRLQNSISN